MIDRLLLWVRARLEHLALHAPSRAHELRQRASGSFDEHTRIYATAAIDNRWPANLRAGKHLRLHGAIRMTTPEARVTIGEHVYIGPGTRIVCDSAVTIGSYVLIADQVDIADTDSHALDWRARREELTASATDAPFSRAAIATAPVVIEDDVWIGVKATVLKGVRIGRGAVVAAGAVVTQDVEPFTLVAGVPARKLRELTR